MIAIITIFACDAECSCADVNEALVASGRFWPCADRERGRQDEAPMLAAAFAFFGATTTVSPSASESEGLTTS